MEIGGVVDEEWSGVDVAVEAGLIHAPTTITIYGRTEYIIMGKCYWISGVEDPAT